MLLAPVPWASRVWALPFLSALAYSERYAREAGPAPQATHRVGLAATVSGETVVSGA
jgi:hypothetical protein